MTTSSRRAVHSSAIALALGLAASAAQADYLADGPPTELLDFDDAFVEVSEPTGLAFLPDGRLVITRRTGEVMVRTTDGELVEAGALDVSTSFGEKGLLNVVVHPDYATNNIIYLYYTGQGQGSDDNRVVTMELSEDNVLDLDSEIRLVEGIAAPLNHDGGGLAIDGDYLFIGTGDSGNNSSAHPSELEITNYYPTCLTNLNGKLLRLHLDGSIPDDNPLIGQTVTACGGSPGAEPSGTSTEPREEIFAWGFRNAFRVWSDPISHNLWVGNVGEVTFEMVSVVPPTGNVHLGWPFREGNEGAPSSACQDILPNVGDCKDSAYRCETNNPSGPGDNADVPNDCNSMSGGLIFTGCEWPAELEGKYIFGDYSNELIWTFEVNDARDDAISERVDFGGTQGGGPVAFVEHEGALYVAVYSKSGGHITKITPKAPEAACDGETPPDPPDGSAGAPGLPPEDGGQSTTPDPDPTDTTDPATDDDTGTDVTDTGDDGPTDPPNGAGGTGGDTDPPAPTATTSPTTTSNPPAGDDATPDDATPDDGGDDATGDDTAPTGSMPGVVTNPVDSDAEEDSGCGCRVIGDSNHTGNRTGALSAALAGLALAALRRRKPNAR